jgi:peptidyl-prolyl cis-trans isomerase C
MMPTLRRIASEPMVIFAAVGVALFALSLALDVRRETLIRLDEGEIALIASHWEAQTQRKPTRQELAGFIQERVDEEILYREALRLGLDADDVIVRRRLAQKVAFLNQDIVEEAAPTDAELRAYYERNRAAYAAPDLVTFEHVYFSPDRRGEGLDAAAAQALEQLTRTDGSPQPGELGDTFMLARVYTDTPLTDLELNFGQQFAETMRTLPTGRWVGPVESALGAHIVRIDSRREATAPPYESVVERVHEDFVAERRRVANAAWIESLRERYRIEVEYPSDLTS